MAVLTVQQIKDEITLDPAGLGFTALLTAGRNNAITDLLNAVPPSAPTIAVDVIDPVDAQAAVVASEWGALTSAVKQRLWLALVGLQSIPVRNTKIRDQVKEVWGVGTATRTALGALQTRPATRAEELTGADADSRTATVVTIEQVRQALRLP